LIKDHRMRVELGRWLLPMFGCMADRGPDSAGLAVFSEPLKGGRRRYSLFAPAADYDWSPVAASFETVLKGPLQMSTVAGHAALITEVAPDVIRGWLKTSHPDVHLLAVGKSIELFKDEGHPMEIAERYGYRTLSGSHAVGHTRMATESAVSPAHAHPFTAGEDFCLVHNGSLSNHHVLRRKLEKFGLTFETDNDTEAACRLIEWHMRQGDDVVDSLRAACAEMDGFYTLLIGTANEMMIVRDPFACKPAVVAETAEYVAISSEFRSLAHLPGIEEAQIFEPLPEEIYSWKVT
jgi:glutamate synthase domain-containing protein 1